MGQTQNNKDKSSSPYFVVMSDEDELARLPLKSTQVDVDISGVIADVNVKQTYTNVGKSTIEAIYVFPASTRAAVYAMKMQIGERTIIAKIEEKQKARTDYEIAKKEGRIASLLEEERPNVFRMNVANIVPGATVEVDMSYTELLVPRDKIYEFVYPTVVGPRYVSKGEYETQTNEEWTGNPYLEEGEVPSSTLNIALNLSCGLPIQDIRCETHKNDITYIDKSTATIALDDPQGGNRDFVVQYRLAGDEIESGILLYEDDGGEKFFLAMMQPPAEPKAEQMPPREYIFIVDISGSMHGFPLDVSQRLMKSLLSGLRENDLFNIVCFAGGSNVYAEKSLSATDENINKAITFINRRQGGGGTELLNALQKSMSLNAKEGYARSFIILTDGYVSVEKETFDYIRQNLGNANFFSFGIGSSVNRYLIEGMAHVGYGEPFIALGKREADVEAKRFQKYISQPIMTDISYAFDGFEAYDLIPEHMPDLFAERPLIISGKYKGNAQGTLTITGTTGKKEFSKTIKINKDKTTKPFWEGGESIISDYLNSEKQNKALKYLWAREKIRLLSDYNSLGRDYWSEASGNKKTLASEITALGLQYNLLTEYTSFIAVDSEISNQGGEQTSVKQALPLPQGVSNKALSGSLPQIKRAYTGVLGDVLLCEEEEIEIVESDDQIFMVVEKMPEFPGGKLALQQYLADSLIYPPKAIEQGIEGRVYVSFTIDATGKIMDVKILRSVHPLLDAEALRVVKAMPRWVPGEQRGKVVNVSYNLPIAFSLGEK